MKMKRGLVAFTLLAAFFVLLGWTEARVHMVYPDGSGAYSVIQEAIDSSADGDTVMLVDGIYAGRGNMDLRYYGKAITLCSQSGNAASCLIDVRGEVNEAAERGFIFDNGEDTLSVLRDLTIINGSADGPCPACEGGAIYAHLSSPKIVNVICRANYAASGAAIMVTRGNPIIRNCQLVNNTAIDGGGLLCIDSSNVKVENCLFSGNHCDLRGGGISLQSGTVVSLINCTISNNRALQGAALASWEADYIVQNSIISYGRDSSWIYAYGQSDFTFTYSDIFGNAGGDWIAPIDSQGGINGNICSNPLFADTSSGDFRLTQNSPCIDTGNPASPPDPDNTRADMGAFYFHHGVAVDDDISKPMVFSLSRNYPNPFNAATTIEFSLGRPSEVTIDIYDLLGRAVAMLDLGRMSPGRHEVSWNAGDNPSGVYFYRLRVDGDSETRRMVLLK